MSNRVLTITIIMVILVLSLLAMTASGCDTLEEHNAMTNTEGADAFCGPSPCAAVVVIIFTLIASLGKIIQAIVIFLSQFL